MNKNSTASEHNRGQTDRSNSSGGRGQDNYHPPHSWDPTGGLLMNSSEAKERDAYNHGWSHHSDQTSYNYDDD